MSNHAMLSVGPFVFRVSTLAYQEFRRTTRARWESQYRVGKRPVHEFLGRGDDEIQLLGVTYPDGQVWRGPPATASREAARALQGPLIAGGGVVVSAGGMVDIMRTMQARGVPLAVVGGDGAVMGLWVLLDIRETATEFREDGTPRRVRFDFRLRHYGMTTAEYAALRSGAPRDPYGDGLTEVYGIQIDYDLENTIPVPETP